MRLIAADGKTVFKIEAGDVFVIDGEDFQEVNRTCAFLFSSRINMDEEDAKNKLFMFVLSDKMSFVFVLNKAAYKNCLQLAKCEFVRDDLLYYEDIIVFKYGRI